MKASEYMTAQEISEMDMHNEFVVRMLEMPIRQGFIEYVLKPAGKYPARVYLFIDAANFQDRNRRVQGCMGRVAFASRSMDRHEVIRSHFAYRMEYIQYENIDALIEDETGIVGQTHPLIQKLNELKASGFFNNLKGKYKPKGQEQLDLFNQ
jgi:hypothetical protein